MQMFGHTLSHTTRESQCKTNALSKQPLCCDAVSLKNYMPTAKPLWKMAKIKKQRIINSKNPGLGLLGLKTENAFGSWLCTFPGAGLFTKKGSTWEAVRWASASLHNCGLLGNIPTTFASASLKLRCRGQAHSESYSHRK